MRYLAAVVCSVIAAPPVAAQDVDRTATAVFAAAADGNVKLLQDYLDAGYDVNYQRKGDTALSVAVVFKKAAAVRLLLDRGADPAMLTYEEHVVSHQTPRPLIDYARNSSSPEIVRLLEARLAGPPQAAGPAVTPAPALTPAPTQVPAATATDESNLLSQFRERVRKDPALLKAARQTQSGAAATAIPKLEAYTVANPRNAEAWYLLGMAYAATGQQNQSNSAATRAINLDPKLNELTSYLIQIGAMAAGTTGAQAPTGSADTAAVPNKPESAPAAGQQEWPQAGSISAGERVLMSTSGGERWRPGVLTEIGSGDFAGLIKAMENPNDSWSGSWLDPSRVVKPAREPFWTTFFVGDWEVSTGGAVNYRTDGRDVYQVVTGGEKLPPLRINLDGTYQWREADTQAKIVTGRWKPRDDAPGIVILSGPRGVDWTLWNTTTISTTKVYKRDQIRVSGPVYSWEALRLSR